MGQNPWHVPMMSDKSMIANQDFVQPTMGPWYLQLADTGAATPTYYSSGFDLDTDLGYLSLDVTNGGSGQSSVRVRQEKNLFGKSNIKLQNGTTYVMEGYIRCQSTSKNARFVVYSTEIGTLQSDLWTTWVADEWTFKSWEFTPTAQTKAANIYMYVGGDTGVIDFAKMRLYPKKDNSAKDLLEKSLERMRDLGNRFNVEGKVYPDSDKIIVRGGKYYNRNTRNVIELADRELTLPQYTARKQWRYVRVFINQENGDLGFVEGEPAIFPDEPNFPELPSLGAEAIPLSLIRLMPSYIGLSGQDIRDERILERMGELTFSGAGQESFTSNDTFTVPATGFYIVRGLGAGGGGGGGSYSGNGGSGGGGGPLIVAILELTKDDVYDVILGTGGVGGAFQGSMIDGNPGYPGGTTYFWKQGAGSALLAVPGGLGGLGGSQAGSLVYGGSGNTWSTYQWVLLANSPGYNGQDSSDTNGAAGGAGGGMMGNGGYSGGTGPGNPGGLYGGGGAGGGATGGGGSYGGAGAKGYLSVEWWR